DRAGALELYNRWAVFLRNKHAYAGCLQIAHDGLAKFPAGKQEGERVWAAELWVRTHDGLLPLGLPKEASVGLERALELLENLESPDARFAQADAHLNKGRFLVQAGQPQEAQLELEAAAASLAAGGHERERAVTLGEIARWRAQTGDVDEALKIH